VLIFVVVGGKYSKNIKYFSINVGNGLEVTGVDENGRKTAPFRHVIVLSGLYADTPARMKVANTMGSASAYLACQWCWLAGAKASAADDDAEEIGKAMLFRGYAKPAPVRVGILAGTQVQIHHARKDPARRLLTSQQMLARAKWVEDNGRTKHTAKVSVCLGLSLVMKELPYTDYVNFFMLPFGHTVFLGVVKDFVHLMLGSLPASTNSGLVISSEAKKMIKAAEAAPVLTSDFGRPFKSVVEKSGSYVMENWCRLIEVYSVYIFSPDVHGEEVLPPLAKKAWGHLRRFVMHHMRGHSTIDPRASRQAKVEILEFAKIMDEVSFVVS